MSKLRNKRIKHLKMLETMWDGIRAHTQSPKKKQEYKKRRAEIAAKRRKLEQM